MTSARTCFADISSNNGSPNVGAYKRAGHQMLMLKATEGTGYTWFAGQTLADEAHAHHLTVGHYGWIRPDSPARAQADFFVASVKSFLEPGDVLMGDFEATAGASDPGDADRAQQLRTWATRVSNQLPGHELWIYTGNWYLAGKPHCQAECQRWSVVMSDYSSATVLPNPYRLNYVAWQFTDRATVPGVPGTCDYNRLLTTTGGQTGGHRLLNGARHMYSLYHASDTGHWYIGTAGYWQRLASKRALLDAMRDPQCVNGHVVHSLAAHTVPKKERAAAWATFQMPTAQLARIKNQLLKMGA